MKLIINRLTKESIDTQKEQNRGIQKIKITKIHYAGGSEIRNSTAGGPGLTHSAVPL